MCVCVWQMRVLLPQTSLLRHEVKNARQDSESERLAVCYDFHKFLEMDNEELEVLKKERCNSLKRNLG